MSYSPKITVITPSYNQGEYLERTIRSVLDQGYPNLEYIIIDGGSTDDSVDIIKKYENELSYWVSEPDRGQVDAINKGLRKATGEWVAWQNSDDIYYSGAFEDLRHMSSQHPEADLIIGNLLIIDEKDNVIRDNCYVTPSYGALLAEGMVMVNQAAFWRRRLHDEIGYINESYNYSFDYDWFLRISKISHGVHVNRFWGGFRLHGATKTRNSGQLFTEENRIIIGENHLPPWKITLYRIRRMFLLLAQGNIAYVVRGLRNRLQGKQEDFI